MEDEAKKEYIEIKVPLFPGGIPTTVNGQKGWMVGHNFYPEEVVRKSLTHIPQRIAIKTESGEIIFPAEVINVKTAVSWEEIAYKLWKIIDDIDTISDLVKGDEKAYRTLVERKQGERFKVLDNAQVDALYDKYYPKETKDNEE